MLSVFESVKVSDRVREHTGEKWGIIFPTKKKEKKLMKS
jgi:hypothetical protein